MGNSYIIITYNDLAINYVIKSNWWKLSDQRKNHPQKKYILFQTSLFVTKIIIFK